MLSGDDFDADIAERYGWVNRTLDDDDLDSFVDALVRRLASFDREALGAVKAQVNRFGTPTATELKSSTDIFFSALAWPGQLSRRAKVRTLGYGLRSDFELNFGRYFLRSGGRTTMTRISSPTDRRPGFLNSAPTFAHVDQRRGHRWNADGPTLCRAGSRQTSSGSRYTTLNQHRPCEGWSLTFFTRTHRHVSEETIT